MMVVVSTRATTAELIAVVTAHKRVKPHSSMTRPFHNTPLCFSLSFSIFMLTKNKNRGVKETVQTFPTYLVLATHLFQSKGASVIISSTTPDNPMTAAGKVDYQPSRFVTLAQKAAKDANVVFVDHGYFVAQAYEKLSAATVNSFFPLDRVHTSPAGAKVVAESFMRALETTNSDLKKSIKAGTVPAV